MAARAAVVVTGTEVLTGRVTDRNGPWLAEQLRRLGVDIAAVTVVGDRPADLHSALDYLLGADVDLVITSGGLGPTADDLTAAVVANVQGRPLRSDPALERRVAGIVESFLTSRGDQLDAAARAGIAKQALVPNGASVLEPTGTAPGLVVPAPQGTGRPPVVVLPGPPGELQAMWPAAVADPLVVAALAGRSPLEQRTIRLWGTYESELAEVLRAHDDLLDGLEVTTCLREGELEIVTRFGPDAAAGYDRFEAFLVEAFAATVYSTDGRTVLELVTDRLTERGLTVAVADAVSGGVLGAELTTRAGSSAYFLAAVAPYANAAKTELLDVPAELIARVGAVSTEVAEAMARGVQARLHADVGIAITGIAG
ncbi:MAG: nicotinamide-nucleotide amidohydrolase family protein, partial [Janthinobacterium lividum]